MNFPSFEDEHRPNFMLIMYIWLGSQVFLILMGLTMFYKYR